MRTALPAPAPGSVRRTLSLEVAPDPDWSAGLRISAFGRDLVYSPDCLVIVSIARDDLCCAESAVRLAGHEQPRDRRRHRLKKAKISKPGRIAMTRHTLEAAEKFCARVTAL